MRMVLISVSLLAAACSGAAEDAGTLTVAASVAPFAEAAERVLGGRGEVVEIVPPGAEPHDVDLSPAQVEEILDADLLVVAGGGFQPAIEDLAARRDGETVIAPAPGGDPHVWLAPRLLGAVAGQIAEALTRLDPPGADAYRERVAAYAEELRALDAEYAARLEGCARRTIVVAHAAFGHLAAEYGLEQVGVAGLEPESEPNPSRLDEIATLIEREGITTIYTEPRAPSDAAEALARGSGVEVAVLDPIETLTDEQRARGEDHASVMRRNLDALAEGLACD